MQIHLQRPTTTGAQGGHRRSPCALTLHDADRVVVQWERSAEHHHTTGTMEKERRHLDMAWYHFGMREGIREAIGGFQAAIRQTVGRRQAPKARARSLEGTLDAVTAEQITYMETLLSAVFDHPTTHPELLRGIRMGLEIVRRSPDLRTAYRTVGHVADQYIAAWGEGGTRHDVARRRLLNGLSAVMQTLGKFFPTGHVTD